VQEHGGKIMCYNGQNGGAVFLVELPAALAALAALSVRGVTSGSIPLPTATSQGFF